MQKIKALAVVFMSFFCALPCFAQELLPKIVDPAVASTGPGMIGKKEAPIVVSVYQDMKCGMCGYFNKKMLPTLKEEYIDKGKVSLVYKDFPLGFRKKEVKIAKAARCAGEQDKYVEFVEHLYNNMKEVTLEKLDGYAKTVSLNVEKFQECKASERHDTDIEKDFKLGKSLGVEGTPTFFVQRLDNGEIRKVRGARWSRLKEAIDATLKGIG